MDQLLEQLKALTARKERFTFDLRGRCQVYEGVVSAYRITEFDRSNELTEVAAHALAHDGILGAWRDPGTKEPRYESCRLFTDVGNAKRFAREQGQRSIYNLNRHEEIPVDDEHSPRSTK